MSIPKFNNDGNLPEGIHLTEEVEFVRRFSIGSARRKWLGERLQGLFVLAKLTGKLERIFVWGSFVSAKECNISISTGIPTASPFCKGELRPALARLVGHM